MEFESNLVAIGFDASQCQISTTWRGHIYRGSDISSWNLKPHQGPVEKKELPSFPFRKKSYAYLDQVIIITFFLNFNKE